MTYTAIYVPVPRKCDDCGALSMMVFVADAVEDATGYRDEVCFCPECMERRDVVEAGR